MTPDLVLALASESGLVLLSVAGPLLVAALVVGLLVSVVQAVTQLQELTLSFIPKLAAVGLVLALLGHWMLGRLIALTTGLLSNLPDYAR